MFRLAAVTLTHWFAPIVSVMLLMGTWMAGSSS
jgi:hypothetical protein